MVMNMKNILLVFSLIVFSSSYNGVASCNGGNNYCNESCPCGNSTGKLQNCTLLKDLSGYQCSCMVNGTFCGYVNK